jgi:hypothetical protein
MVIAEAASSVAGIITSAASIATVVGIAMAIVVGIFQIRKLREEGEDAGRKLDVIHRLVNSTLTTAIESDLAATRQGLDTMTELVRVLTEAGKPVAPETVAAMEASRVKIGALTQELADRLHSAEDVLAEEGKLLNPAT